MMGMEGPIRPFDMIKLWNLAAGLEIQTWTDHPDNTVVSLNHDERGRDGVCGFKIKLWDWATGKEILMPGDDACESTEVCSRELDQSAAVGCFVCRSCI